MLAIASPWLKPMIEKLRRHSRSVNQIVYQR
jgi:hypothetical protein